MLFKPTHHTIPFRQWLYRDKENRTILVLAAIALIIQFWVYKIFFPYPNFLPESTSYIEAAFRNSTISAWPIGYSKFLRLVSSFTTDDTTLIFIQFALLQAGMLYFLYSIKYLLSPNTWAIRIAFAILLLNPFYLHVSNIVSSDALFTALSLVWFTQLLWMMYHPTAKLLLWHAIVLLFCFTVRYAALYYPFISIATILFLPATKKVKIVGISAIIILVGYFIGRTQYQYKKITNKVQFSAFGGWQKAANALYAYAHADTIDRHSVPGEFWDLHALVNDHLKTLQTNPFRPDKDLGIYYQWDDRSPLKQYFKIIAAKDSGSDFKKWAAPSKLYAKYGDYLIQRYPGEYVSQFIVPNFKNYFAPPAEAVFVYNSEMDTVQTPIVRWFKWKGNHVHILSKKRGIASADIYPIYIGILHALFLVSFIALFVLRGGRSFAPYELKVLTLVLGYWLINTIFSVLTAYIVLRYETFSSIITLTVSTILLGYISQLAFSPLHTHLTHTNSSPEKAGIESVPG